MEGKFVSFCSFGWKFWEMITREKGGLDYLVRAAAEPHGGVLSPSLPQQQVKVWCLA